MTAIHIHAPRGKYIGQIKGYGCRKWRTVVTTRNSARLALAGAVKKMGASDKRARVLYITDDGYYEPNLIMEARKV